MRTRTRRIAATTGGAALCLASLAGCGSNGGQGGDSPAKAPPTTAAAAPVLTTTAVPLTQAQLWNAVITAKDVPGFKVDYTQLQGAPFQPGTPTDQLPPVFPAACTALYWSTQAASTYPPSARIDAIAHTTGTPEQFGNVVLTVYSTADAPKVMADLHTSLQACTNAHIERHDDLGSDISYTHPQTQPTPHLGDDALTYRITQNVAPDDTEPDPLTVPMTFTVVRTGTTVITFWNQGDATSTTPAVIAPQLIPTQITKLTHLTHNPT